MPIRVKFIVFPFSKFIVFPFQIGVKLHEPDRVVEKLEQSIRSREDSVDSNCCVRSRGLPWQASDQDIARFFIGLNVARYDTQKNLVLSGFMSLLHLLHFLRWNFNFSPVFL